MSIFPSAFHSRIYSEFKDIEAYNYRQIVDFYNEHEEDIQRLKFDEFFEVQITYIDALFEICAYENLIPICDATIEAVIIHNIQFYQGEDIYRKLLIKKASAHYNLLEYHKAEYILKELIKINPKDKKSIWLLKKCFTYRPPFYVKYTRGASLLFFLMTALVITFEMFYFGLNADQSAFGSFIEIARNMIFMSGWFILILGDGIFRFKVHRAINVFVKNIKMEKHQPAVQASSTSSKI